MACVIFVSACQSISVVFFSFVVESVHGISFQLIFFVKDDYKYLRRKPTDTYSGWLLKKDIMIKGTVSQFSACENGSDREMPLFAWYWNCCSLSTSH